MKNLPAKEALKHAHNPETSAAQLHELAQHPSGDVQRVVAAHPNTAEHTLQHLHDNAAGEHAKKIKGMALGHHNAPAALIHQALKEHAEGDPSSQARSYRGVDHLVQHPKAYPDVVNKTMHDMIQKHGKDEAGNPQNLPFDTKYAASSWLKGPHASAEDAAKYLNHHDENMVDAALQSGKLKEGHFAEHFGKQKKLDKEQADKVIENNKDLSPEFLKSIHQRSLSEKDKDYNYTTNDLKESIYKHPNVPKEILDEEIEKGEKSRDYGSWSAGARRTAFKHPSIDPAVIDSKARAGDQDAVHAALHREDTEPSLLEHLWGKASKVNKKSGFYSDKSMKDDLLRHSNFPEALAQKDASKDTDLARALLKKKTLSPDTLKEIVMHKNQDVALEALKHPNVDASVVDHAFKRKAATVSRAAADHELATPEMKMQKVEADPEAAAMIANDADPQMAKAIFDKHGHHHGVAQGLLRNKELSPDIIKAISAHADAGKYTKVKNDRGYNRDKTEDIQSQITRHPNLDSDLRRKILKDNPYYAAAHPGIRPDEMLEALNYHKNGTHRDAAVNTMNMAGTFLGHDNMTPDLAKRIVSGEFGPARESINEDDLNKPHMTRDVIKAGLEAQPELVNHDLVKKLAQSSQLTPEDIKGYINQPFATNFENEQRFHTSRARGLLENEKAPREVLAQAINGELKHSAHDQYGSLARAALGNPSLGSNDLERHFQDFDKFEKTLNSMSKNYAPNYIDDVKDAIRGRGLEDDALMTAHPEVVSSLIKRSNYGGEIHKDKFAKAMEHSVPSVVQEMIKRHGSQFNNADQETKAKVFDRFASDPNSDLAKTAYPHMSKAGQEKMLQSADMNDPFVIKNASRETVKGFKITPDTSEDVVHAIVGHSGATPDQINSAVEHSQGAADQILNRLRDTADKKGRRGDFNLDAANTSEFKDAVHQKILDTHTGVGTGYLARKVLRQTNNPDTIKKAIQRPDSLGYISAIAENKSVKSGDLDYFKKHTDPESSQAMGYLAGSNKASTGLLSHIAQHYPEHLPAIASNPKAGSAKLLKTLIDKGDLQTHAELAKNEKVPDEVRGHLMKNPKVLMAADPKKATPEMLDELSKGDDIDLHKFIVDNPNATPEHRATSVKYALGKMKSGSPEDSQKAQRIVEAGLSKPLHESALDEISAQSEDHAARALKNEGATPALASKYLDHYKGSPKVLDALVDSDAANHPAVMDKMLDHADFKADDQNESRYYAPARMNQMLMRNDESLKDSHIEKFYNKLKEARPEGHKYQNDHIRMSDASSMKWVAKNVANPEIQKEFMQNPGALKHLAENNRLSKQNYESLVNKYTGMYGKSGPYVGDPWTSERSDDRHEILESLVDHSQANSNALDTLWRHTAATNDDLDHDVIDQFARSRRISPETAEDIFTNHPGVTSMLRNPVLPNDRLKQAIEQQFGHTDNLPDEMKERRPDSGLFKEIASNPKFRLSMLKDIPQDKLNSEENRGRSKTMYRHLLKNNQADTEDLRKAFDGLAKKDQKGNYDLNRYDNEHLNDLINNPKSPEDLLRKLSEHPDVSKDDFYHSPAIGGELWRERKHQFPSGLQGLESGKETNTATFKPREDKIKQVQSMVPEGGKLVWGDFKKQYPSLAGDPLVQKMFTSAPKQMVDQAHAQKYLDEMPKKDFHVSYVPWNGMQRHNDKTQAVFQLNNGQDQDVAYKSDPNMLGLYKMIQKAGYRSGHPVNPQSIGWSRVDTSNPDHWFIDEVQSDYGSGLSRELDQLQKTGRSEELENHGIDPAQAKPTLNKLVDIIQGWDRALVNNIIETAKKHGVKKISMHSGESKTLVNKGKQAEVTNKYDKLYNKMPQEMGFKEDLYDNVPSGSKETPLKGQKVWTLNFNPDEEEELKNKRREKLHGKMAMKNPKDEGGNQD